MAPGGPRLVGAALVALAALLAFASSVAANTGIPVTSISAGYLLMGAAAGTGIMGVSLVIVSLVED